MKIILNEGNQIHNFMSSSGSGTVINNGSGSGSGSDFLTSYGSVSGSKRQKVTVPTVPVPVPLRQRWLYLPYFTTYVIFRCGWAAMISIWSGWSWSALSSLWSSSTVWLTCARRRSQWCWWKHSGMGRRSIDQSIPIYPRCIARIFFLAVLVLGSV